MLGTCWSQMCHVLVNAACSAEAAPIGEGTGEAAAEGEPAAEVAPAAEGGEEGEGEGGPIQA